MKLAFNSSLPRSGSTLLQNILAQNPRFHCTPTSPLFDILCGAREVFTRLPESQAQDRATMKKAFLGLCAGAMQGYASSLTDRPVCVDKSRVWIREYDWLSEFYPRPKIIITVRDLRSVLSSIEKKWRKFSYLHRPEQAADPSGMKMATIEGRVAHWLNSVPVGNMIVTFLGAAERGILKECHIVRFEDLTSQPQQTLNAVYDYLEEPQFSHDFSNVEQLTHENDALYPYFADHVIRPEVKPVPLDYHEILGKTLSNTIKQDNAPFYTTFYPGR